MKRYFKTHEVVCPHILGRFGDEAWRFFDPRLLEVIGWLRTALNREFLANNYNLALKQRGLRCNLCRLVGSKTHKRVCYMSAHVLGAALDFNVEGMTTSEVHEWLYEHALELPYPIRLEKHVRWVHLDVATEGPDKIVWF